MTALATGVPHVTDAPVIDVENALKPGQHRFRLTVFDESRNESEPAFITVTVNEAQREPRFDPRIDIRPETRPETRVERFEPRVQPRVDPRIIERVVLQPTPGPNLGEVLRNRIPRRPGG